MRILIDTNILIDYILKRQPFTVSAEKIMLLCKNKKIDGCVAAHSLMNIFYILRKEMTVSERKDFLHYLSEITEIIGIDKRKILAALDNGNISDFEDSLQDQCAQTYACDYIITRNIKDFDKSSICAILPDKFLELINE